MTDDREGTQQILFRMRNDLVEFIDAEKNASGRSRAWLIEHAVEIWRRRLDRERANRDRLRTARKGKTGR